MDQPRIASSSGATRLGEAVCRSGLLRCGDSFLRSDKGTLERDPSEVSISAV